MCVRWWWWGAHLEMLQAGRDVEEFPDESVVVDILARLLTLPEVTHRGYLDCGCMDVAVSSGKEDGSMR